MKHARGILFSVPQKSHKWRRMACNCVYVSDPFPNPYEEAHALRCKAASSRFMLYYPREMSLTSNVVCRALA